jgi:hypothetical protein
MKIKNVKINLSLLIALLVALGLLMIGCSKKESSEQSTTTPQAEQPAADTASATAAQPAATPEQAQPTAAATPAEYKPANDKPAQPAAKEETSEAASATAAEVILAPIDIKLPKPMFIGTPSNLQVPNLEKPLGKPRPPFLAPEGTTNVAAGRPVKSTDEAPVIGELKMVTDDDCEAGDGSYVELGPFLQNVTIDLGKKHNIYAILVWHYHKQPRVYFDMIVQVEKYPNFTYNVSTV